MPDGDRKKRSDAGLPQTQFHTLTFRDFAAMNTQAARQALKPEEFAWLENLMPLGHGNLKIVPGPSAPLTSGWAGTAYTMQSFNRGGVNFMFLATTTGDLYEVPLDFAGYGVAALTVTNAGVGYFRTCNVAFTGSANVAAVATINIKLVKAVAASVGLPPVLTGTGYVVGDVLTATGGTFNRAAKVQVTSVNGSGAPLGYVILDGGDYSFYPGALVSTTGGTGTGAKLCGGPFLNDPSGQLGLGGFGLGGTITIVKAGSGYVTRPLANAADGILTGDQGIAIGTVAVTTSGSPHTLTHIGGGFTGNSIQIAQWADERILIIDPATGMWDWDGSTLTSPTAIFSITITSPGSYTTIPTISFGAPGSGGAATANMGINGPQVIAAAGSGYQVGDILTLQGGTFTQQATVKVTTLSGSGVTAVSVVTPGSYTALPSNPVATKATAGGSGTGCTLTANWGVLSATITARGTGYSAASAVNFSAGAAAGTLNVIGAPTNPHAIAVYAQRVWIVDSTRRLWNSAAGVYNDFLSVSAGVKVLQDPTLNSNVTGLFAANSYLYYTGVNSVNVISDVTVNANGNTVYSDTNLDASTGTNFGASIVPYLRSSLFLSDDGIYSLYGSAPTKISDAMDGVFDGIDFHGVISAGVFTLFDTLCAAFLILYNTSGQPSNTFNSTPLMMVYFRTRKGGDRWFVANQDTLGRLTVIENAPAFDPNLSKNLYGTDGFSLYRLFDDPTNLQSWELQTAYWDMGKTEFTKEVTSFAIEQDGNEGGTVSVSLDMIQKEPPYVQSEQFDVPLSNIIPWLNNANNPIPWLNSVGAVIPWITSGYILDMQDESAFGKYVGVTATSSDVQGVITSIMLRYIFREQW